MIQYCIKQNSKYLSNPVSFPNEFKANTPEDGYRWANKQAAQKVATENVNSRVVEVALAKVNNFYWTWTEI